MRISDWSSDVCSSDLEFLPVALVGIEIDKQWMPLTGPVIGRQQQPVVAILVFARFAACQQDRFCFADTSQVFVETVQRSGTGPVADHKHIVAIGPLALEPHRNSDRTSVV